MLNLLVKLCINVRIGSLYKTLFLSHWLLWKLIVFMHWLIIETMIIAECTGETLLNLMVNLCRNVRFSSLCKQLFYRRNLSALVAMVSQSFHILAQNRKNENCWMYWWNFAEMFLSLAATKTFLLFFVFFIAVS